MSEVTGTLLRHRARLNEMASVLARHGLAEWAARGSGIATARPVDTIVHRVLTPEEMGASTGERLRGALTELGTTYIKFGQMLSLRPDLVGEDVANELSKLQAAVPADPPGVAQRNAEAQPALANYLVRFADAYAAEGVPIFALTLQNEPGFEPGNYPGMKLDPKERANIIGRYLGPALAHRQAPTLILDWDHNWDVPSSPLAVLADPVASRYVAGVAWHCYNGDVEAQAPVHDAHPDKDAYLTECSGGDWDPKWAKSLRWFTSKLIIGSTRGWSRGVVLWNLALDEKHGPHAGGCTDCRGVVTIDSATGAITRNVEYYVLGHASRFVRPGAHRIDSTPGVKGLESVAFQNADDGSLALIVLNNAHRQRQFSVSVTGRSFQYALPAGAVVTFVWKP